ncbi:hypothetical protein SAY86_025416 [Trapa natans]|uniref:Uncharacterized protein n=1 Tax=Trapa natans TaxID=22666 RepID=A0AAN7M892_TRANT|nr:hypothetical protein SAY86_025416 [Trapa natans]
MVVLIGLFQSIIYRHLLSLYMDTNSHTTVSHFVMYIAAGMIKLCCLSSITGRKLWQRNNLTDSSGMSTWTRITATRTTTTGPSTSHEVHLEEMHVSQTSKLNLVTSFLVALALILES